MDRRYFFKALASGLVAATAPGLFLPKLIKPAWKVPEVDEVPVQFAINPRGGSVEDLYVLLGILEEFRYSLPPLRGVNPMPGSKLYFRSVPIGQSSNS